MNVERYTSFLARRGRIVLVVTAVLMLTAVAGIFQLKIQTNFDIFMPPDSPQGAAIDRMADAFGDAEQIVALVDVGESADRLPICRRLWPL